MIFNPYNWSTVVNSSVNISLISALLFSFSLLITLGIYELSNEKLSWDYWHGWMKRNAEVATNIERQRRERESEEVNSQCSWSWIFDEVANDVESQDSERGSFGVSCMRRFPIIKILGVTGKILVTVVLGLWPAGNI